LIKCYPEKIKKNPRYDEFIAKIDFINNEGWSREERNRLRKITEKKYGILIIPLKCDDTCPYKQQCKKENTKLRADMLSKEDGDVYGRYDRRGLTKHHKQHN